MTPWVVVTLHRPFYVVMPHKENRIVGDHLRDFVEGLLLDYRVDLTVSGHVHTYYRTCNVRSEACTSDGSGVSHFVVGTGGHELSGILDVQKEWVEASEDDWGFVRFDVDPSAGSMRARFMRSRDGSVADEATLYSRVDVDTCRSRHR